MPSFDISYTYDAAGNRLTKTDNETSEVTTYTYDGANRLLSETDSSGTTNYEYDADGNRTKRETPTTTTFYEWDQENHLTVAEPAAGSVTLTYNGDGQRVKKETPTETKKFIYDFKTLLQETDGSDETQHLFTSTNEEYGDLVSEFGDGESSYFQYDALGSADALLDADESVTDRYQYQAFGLASHTSGNSENPFTFVGKSNYYHDPELELYLLGMGNSDGGGRHYDPATGAFLSEDPAEDDTNLYRYAANNPINIADPSGQRGRATRVELEGKPKKLKRVDPKGRTASGLPRRKKSPSGRENLSGPEGLAKVARNCTIATAPTRRPPICKPPREILKLAGSPSDSDDPIDFDYFSIETQRALFNAVNSRLVARKPDLFDGARQQADRRIHAGLSTEMVWGFFGLDARTAVEWSKIAHQLDLDKWRVDAIVALIQLKPFNPLHDLAMELATDPQFGESEVLVDCVVGIANYAQMKKDKRDYSAALTELTIATWAEKELNELDEIQTKLDLIGFLPIVGEIVDAANGLIYIARGRHIDGGISFAAMIPLVGDTAKSGRYIVKIGDVVLEAPDARRMYELIEAKAKRNLAPRSSSASFPTKQLEKKWKHAPDFGITTPKRNPTTLAQYEKALAGHLDDAATVPKGKYLYVDDSTVYFNPNTNLAVVLDKNGTFVTGWKLTPGTPQFENFINNGVLR